MRRKLAIQIAATVLAVTAVAGANPVKKEVAADESIQKPSAAAPTSAPAAASAAIEIGAPAPDFTLKDTDGKEQRLSDYVAQGKIVVLEWFNPDCPFVKKHHEKNKTMLQTYDTFKDKNLVWLAINSGAVGKQGNGVIHNQEARQKYGMQYPVLLDEDGSVGRLYGAKTTPQMFVISKGNVLYAGAIDDNPTPGTLGATNYVTKALDAVVAGKPVEVAQTKSYGCSVKYGTTIP